jgi:tRNA-specific 2-thiouridylase
VPAVAGYDPASGAVEVRLARPASGIAPGQTAVLYDGSRVIGSSIITSTHKSATRAL